MIFENLGTHYLYDRYRIINNSTLQIFCFNYRLAEFYLNFFISSTLDNSLIRSQLERECNTDSLDLSPTTPIATHLCTFAYCHNYKLIQLQLGLLTLEQRRPVANLLLVHV